MAAKIEQFEAPRKQFREANKHLQEKVQKSILVKKYQFYVGYSNASKGYS